MVGEYWMVCKEDIPVNDNQYVSYFDAVQALSLYQNEDYSVKCFKEELMPDAVADRLAAEVRAEISHSHHYTSGGIECADAIRAILTPEEFRGFCKGNIIQHIWRKRIKGGDELLKKAEWYTKRLLDEHQN